MGKDTRIDIALRTAIESVVQSINVSYDELLSAFRTQLDELARTGQISLGEDHCLASWALEVRVENIFGEMQFAVLKGRKDMEDFIVQPGTDSKPPKPLVIEVKSGKQSSPDRSSLRQLDDWVFELSGEEEIRKGVKKLDMHWVTENQVMLMPRGQHPTPHKGVFIYNGPVGTPFINRPETWLGENERLFAEKRDFCVISLECLLSWYESFASDVDTCRRFWAEVHATRGVLRKPY
ncbi:MAG TPA: hypothetical protein VMY37_05565 [Thermoguttaceae bacterium]|nr:hypothetical protein [Thermoguttaceae bacterium]